MIVAIDTGELSEACRALGRLAELRGTQNHDDAVDYDVLDRLVEAVTRAPADENNATEGGDARAPGVVHNPNEGHGLYPRVNDLFERTLLPMLGGRVPRLHRAHARLLTWRRLWPQVLEAYLIAYRCGPAAQWDRDETDTDKWRDAAHEVSDIVDVLRNFGPRVEGSRWVAQSRSVVRSFLGRSKEFEEEEEYTRLKEELEDLKNEAD
jgi:hypothetical protein